MGNKNVDNLREKRICILSVFIAIFPPTYFVSQANPPEVEFQGIISKFRERNKISPLLVYVLHRVDFQCRVIFTCEGAFANKIEAMHERSLANVKVEPRLTSRLSSALFILPYER